KSPSQLLLRSPRATATLLPRISKRAGLQVFPCLAKASETWRTQKLLEFSKARSRGPLSVTRRCREETAKATPSFVKARDRPPPLQPTQITRIESCNQDRCSRTATSNSSRREIEAKRRG